MIMAFIAWMLMKMGVEPSPEDFARMDREFRERGHHAVLDFGGARNGTIRWSDDNWSKQIAVGVGYEYLADRRYNGVGLEVLGESRGNILRPGGGPHSFFVGGGLNYYPIRSVRLLAQGGTQIDMHGNTEAVGRAGLGFRFMFFSVSMQPYVYVQQTSTNDAGWAIRFRFEY